MAKVLVRVKYFYLISKSEKTYVKNRDFRKLIDEYILKEYKNLRKNFRTNNNIFNNYQILSELLDFLYKDVECEHDFFHEVLTVIKKIENDYDVDYSYIVSFQEVKPDKAKLLNSILRRFKP